MMQLNIDKDYDGTYCWSVWEMDPEDYCRVGQRGVNRAEGKGCHSIAEAASFGVKALLDLAMPIQIREDRFRRQRAR